MKNTYKAVEVSAPGALRVADAYARMIQGKARFRMVLVTKDGVAQGAPLN